MPVKAVHAKELDKDFYSRDACTVAAELIGCHFTFNGVGGIVVETEAYRQDDPACHAYRGMTPRNEVLFGPPGYSYVYFTYGIHNLVNFVAEEDGVAAAVLIRAVEPTDGVELMEERRQCDRLYNLCSGPGKLTQALAITLDQNGLSLEDDGFQVRAPDSRDFEIVESRRIGITQATDYLWRYSLAGSRFVSKPWPS